MQNLIKRGAIVHDDWTLVKEASDPEILHATQDRNLIVPIKFWNMYKLEIEDYLGEVTIWLNSDEFLDEIKEEINTFSLIALNFPVFSGGCNCIPHQASQRAHRLASLRARHRGESRFAASIPP